MVPHTAEAYTTTGSAQHSLHPLYCASHGALLFASLGALRRRYPIWKLYTWLGEAQRVFLQQIKVLWHGNVHRTALLLVWWLLLPAQHTLEIGKMDTDCPDRYCVYWKDLPEYKKQKCSVLHVYTLPHVLLPYLSYSVV